MITDMEKEYETDREFKVWEGLCVINLQVWFNKEFWLKPISQKDFAR